MKKIEVEFLGEAAEEWERLNETVEKELKNNISKSESQILLRSIKGKIDIIKNNPEYGDRVPKKLVERSGLEVTNLWVVDLANYWRMLYTISGDKIEIICFILRVINHVEYNKTFGYKKK